MKVKQLLGILLTGIFLVSCNLSNDNAPAEKGNRKVNSKSGKQQKETTVLYEQDNINLPDESESFNSGTDTTHSSNQLQGNEVADVAKERANSTSGNEGKAAQEAEKVGTADNFIATEDENMFRAAASREPANNSRPDKAVMTLENTVFDFGSILTGAKIEHEFKFTNTGKAPLIIHDASSSCGCTVPEIPAIPIPPGETSSVLVRYDSSGKIGSQTKTVTIQTNASPSTYHVVLKGLVLTENMMKEEVEKKETKE